MLRSELRISLLYLLVGVLWITLSDSVLLALFRHTTDTLSLIQIYKGVFYVATTAALLYILLRREFNKQRQQHSILEDREQHFRYLFMNNPQPMFVYSLQTLRFLEVNDAAVEQYGYTRDEFLNLTVKDIRPQEDVAKFVDEAFKSRTPLNHAGEWRHTIKSGKVINVQVTSHTLDFEEHRAVLVIALDITVQKELERRVEESTARLHSIVKNMQDAVWSVDPAEDRLKYVSPAMEKMTGYPEEQLLQQQNIWFDTIVHPDDRPKIRASYEYLLHEGEREIEYQIIRLNGKIRWVLDRAWTTKDENGELIRIEGILSDITEKKQAHDKLLEMERLRLALNKQIELRNFRERFISMISHQFRNPLTTIATSASIIGNYRDRLKPDKQAEHINRIDSQVKRLTGMLNDMLVILRTEAVGTQFQPEEVNIAALCRQLVDQFRQNDDRQHDITIFAPDNIVMTGDQELLNHAVENLLSNAIKYTPEHGKIEVKLDDLDEAVCINVQDTGIGIPESDQAQLFKAFHRAKNVGNIQGTGLGLAITQQAVELHHGSIEFTSIEGQGTTFKLNLPKKPPQNGTTPSPV